MTDIKTLNDSHKIPTLGLGTWMIDNDKVVQVVKDAIELGYRHIDTAQAYGNEKGVGKGIKESGIARESLFVTTKIAAEHKDYESAAKSIDQSLEDLGLEYLDLMIIHSPQPWNEWRETDKNFDQGNLEAWKALEDAQKAGKVKSIGVSNFFEKDLDNILKNGHVKPAVNQILAHIGNTPFDLIDYCQSKDIQVEAYSPIAHGQALKSDGIQKMAEKYGFSVAQLCIQYLLQLDLIVLPKASSKEHLNSNLEFDFVISDEDMSTLKSLVFEDYGEFSNLPVFSGK
ncbi:hypothetical protein HMPREF9318_00606 [Streptococcus urinalis FB127-CNA-2]|uniref:Oxidoreductase, aldo/keto reductase family protein n=1 Tax=Streptococcus urinalis 2285-97 TaxID=764291 RepID=G5KGW7_9STRE|nr:aldo/keto reductase [Streptococcus urinalis]EHJ56121.1 oxidoreductase, aldo/keto reductase family protein [Streptococcus urinalis 2285-97]EKS22408.1 hypothetical protein HMPREF9318_00606 [Streptococcus urinalis FB127-CNA-2]VEF32221.1 2,5-diketo-D-gluconic acid reductase [Streptococcus urinalis]